MNIIEWNFYLNNFLRNKKLTSLPRYVSLDLNKYSIAG